MKRFFAVCEAEADFRIASCLADRKLQATSIDWLRDLLNPDIAMHREWVGASSSSMGHFDGKEHPDAMAARNALIVARAVSQVAGLDGVLMLRDADAQRDRLIGLKSARKQYAVGLAVAIGVADRTREAWVLAGFLPGSEVERALLDAERAALGFDPTREPHRLRDPSEAAPRSAKRVSRALTRSDHEREARCYVDTSLEHLATHGEHAGLKAFLDDVANQLEPLFL